ncbi:hypothetical protein C8R47DRAFT_33368 [Mycena vitilis]|nr:hypothetical protein C8R47DRAFT_33368 [Mycena vitilis]
MSKGYVRVHARGTKFAIRARQPGNRNSRGNFTVSLSNGNQEPRLPSSSWDCWVPFPCLSSLTRPAMRPIPIALAAFLLHVYAQQYSNAIDGFGPLIDHSTFASREIRGCTFASPCRLSVITFDSDSDNDSDPDSDPDQPQPHLGLSKGAIAGIALGTAVFTALLAIGLVFCLRVRNRRKLRDSELPPRAVSNDPVADLAAEMRLVRTQMERLAAQQRAIEGGADSVSVARSLSTMKHEQTRVLREMSPTATNSVEHTDSGLRLTAGSVYHDDGSPPEYVPE